SAFTVYVPFPIDWTWLPFTLANPTAVHVPFPSKVIKLTPAKDMGAAFGAITNPVSLRAKAPLTVALEHVLTSVLSSAFAEGAMPRASTATAPIAKVFAIVLLFMIISFAFLDWLCSERRSFSDRLFPSAGTGGRPRPKPATVLVYFYKPTENRPSIDARTEEITCLLKAWGSGDEAALGRLAEHVYPELRRMARRYMNHEAQGNTLQATALVHEVYLRLVDVTNVEWRARAQFFAIAAQMMRRILVDAARTHGSRR